MITDPTTINMAIPEYQIDKVIGIVTNTFTAVAPTAIQGTLTTTDTKATGVGASCYFQGIYSVDLGVTWNDFGTDVANAIELNGLHITGRSNGNNFSVQAVNNYGTSGITYTVMYKVTLIATNSQGNITPQLTNEAIYWTSGKNYPKIFKQGTVAYNTTSGSQFSISVAHNLGYLPKVSAWQIGFFGAGIISNVQGIAPVIQLPDSNNITFFADAALTTTQNSNIDYRVYLDAH